MESKSASQVLYENGISIMEMNDEFNSSLLKAMEEYKNSCLQDAIKDIEEKFSWATGDENVFIRTAYKQCIEILKNQING